MSRRGICLARACGPCMRRPATATAGDEDYAFGSVAIPNAPCADWPTFWAERRLIASPEALPGDIVRKLKQLTARLPDLLPARPSAALLHGDLWRGNLHFSGGRGYLIDPACYYGHAEVDLAMLTLFGQPSSAFWEGYGALEPGHEGRRAIYQLWPALVHLRPLRRRLPRHGNRAVGAVSALRRARNTPSSRY